jgi:hypothetical protein
MAKLLSFLLRDNAPRDDSRGQPMDSATVRRWLTERAYVNPSNLDCEHCVYYTEWGVPWQILRAVRWKQRPPFWRRFLLLLFFLVSFAKTGSGHAQENYRIAQKNLRRRFGQDNAAEMGNFSRFYLLSKDGSVPVRKTPLLSHFYAILY